MRLIDDESHLCIARVSAGCTPTWPQRAVHGHHRKRRSQGGPDTAVNVIPVCSPCHEWVHSFVDKSIMLGLLIPSWAELTPYVPWWESGDAA
jgi:predicted restriction endonuclease